MGFYDPDVYHQPEKFGLTPVAEYDLSDGNYQFDLIVVWRDAEGVLRWANDSGCSCPSPFEDVRSLEQTKVLEWDEFERFVLEETGYLNDKPDDWRRWDNPWQDVDTFLQKVRSEL